ncbi:peroxiredoxin family protein [Leeuwenhoekiella sp. H156]|uniref:peroxiredoxin family protein n=1 Tax=Leeuwenhoekiella sp. H156 TaxID=3450128 RepID=UPI003FA4C28B
MGRGLAKLYKKYKSKDFEIVSVSMDYDDAKWRNAVEKDQMEWTNLIDSEGLEGDAQLATIFPE